MENVEAVTVGLYVRLEATTGHEEDVESFLREALLGSEPTIERLDLLAAKLPVVALQRQ